MQSQTAPHSGANGGQHRPRLAPEEFERVRSLVRQFTGISIADNRIDMVQGRLLRRVNALGLPSFDAYLSYLKQGHREELENFVNALTTNVTHFFRESHHFDQLAEHLSARLGEGARRLRIWSAGCSSGEEPYSIAMVLTEALSGRYGIDAKILATDIDSTMVQRCRDGVYGREQLEGVSTARKKRFFNAGRRSQDAKVRVTAELKALVRPKPLNLLETWPMKGPFDAIFCRNVLIYFEGELRERLVAQYVELLRPGGYLFLGHSESASGQHAKLRSVGKTCYRRVA